MSEFDPTKIPFNTLNDVSQAIGGARERQSAGVDFVDALVNAAKRQFVPDALQGTGPYKAIVLRVEPSTGKQEPGNFLSNTFGSFFGDPPPMVRVKARIPEIHAALPVPTQLGSANGDHQQVIDLYPTFVAQDTSIEEPKPGDIVNVDFGNKNTYSDPIFLGPLLKPPAGGGAAGGEGGAGVFGDCTGTPNVGLTAPPGDSLPEVNKSKPPTSFIPLAPRTGMELQGKNEIYTGEAGGLINIKNDWEKALKGQAPESSSNLAGGSIFFSGENGVPTLDSIMNSATVKGKTWIGNLPANGFLDDGKMLGEHRDTIIFAPHSTDFSFTNTRLEIIFLFHDLGGFTNEMLQKIATGLGNLTLIENTKETSKTGTPSYYDFARNYVLVIPELPWSVYTNYTSDTQPNNRTNVPINYSEFYNQALSKISEVYGTNIVGNQDKIYTSAISVGSGMYVVKNAISQGTFSPSPNKMVFAPSPSFSDKQFSDILSVLVPKEGGGLPPLPDTDEEQKIINSALGEAQYDDLASLTTYTFLGYDGPPTTPFPTSFDKIVTQVTANIVGDKTTNFMRFQKIQDNIERDALHAVAMVSNLEPQVLDELEAELYIKDTSPSSDNSAEDADNSGLSISELAEKEKSSPLAPTNGGPQDPPATEPASSPSGTPKGSSVGAPASPPDGFAQGEPITTVPTAIQNPDDFFASNSGIQEAKPGDFETLPLDNITKSIQKAAENRVRVKDFGVIPKSSGLLRDLPNPEMATKNGLKLHVLAFNRFEALRKAALDEAGIDFGITSAWRSSGADRWPGGYEGTTPDTYQGFLAKQYPNESFDSAKKWVAWESAHSTGLAIDYGRPDPMAAKKSKQKAMLASPAWDWLRKNSYRFGFFPYANEAWHWEAKMTFDAWATGQEFTPIFSVRVQDVGSKTAALPEGLTPSVGAAGPSSPAAANPQACIVPSGDFSAGPASAGKSYPVIQDPFNGGKSGVIVIGGVEYPFSNMTGHQQFKGKTRKLDKTPPTFIAIHNSVTSTFSGCVRVLLKKGLGVHFTIDIDGRMYQHADPVSQITYHGSPLNYQSVGIETITTFYWKNATSAMKNAGFTESDPYWWMSKSTRFAKPGESMVNSSNRLMAMLVSKIPTLSNTFPSKDLNSKNKRLSGTPAGGIVSHRDYVAKADGRYFLMRYIEKVTGQQFLPDAGLPAFAAEAEAESDLIEATDTLEDLTGIDLF
jgi:hypothetical protein